MVYTIWRGLEDGVAGVSEVSAVDGQDEEDEHWRGPYER